MTRLTRDAYGLRLAEAAASRADCTRRQVGAVIVAEDGSVVATGYNGLASGLPGCASAGACPRGQMAYPSEPPVKVGDIAATHDGPWCEAEGLRDEGFCCTLRRDHGGAWHVAATLTTVVEVWPVAATHPADTGYEATGCRAVHAEVNAIIRAGRDRCIGATIYVTDEPCFHCSVVIEGAGIARVVTPFTVEADALFDEVFDVPATAPPPSGAAPAPTYATGGIVATGSVTGGIRAFTPDGVAEITPEGRGTLTGPLDPEIHAALVRSVERRRREVLPGLCHRSLPGGRRPRLPGPAVSEADRSDRWDLL